MKLRLLVLTAVLMAFVSTGFSESLEFTVKWTDAQSTNWYELTYDCNDPESPVLADSMIIQVWGDYDLSGLTMNEAWMGGYPGMDEPLPVGPDGAAGQIIQNEFSFNSSAITAAAGSFISPTLVFNGNPPQNFTIIYLVAGYYDTGGVFQPLYVSQAWVAVQHAGDIVLHCPPAEGFFGTACWSCVGSFEVPFTCDQDTLFLPWEPWGSFCIDLCAEGTGQVELYIGPFNEACYAHYPNGCVAPIIMPGCEYGAGNCDNSECTPAEFFMDWPLMCWAFYNDQLYFKTHTPLQITRSGCACIFYEGPLSGYSTDCWLPVELMSFTAEPTIHGIRVAFRTGSETDNDYFEILKSEAGGEFEVLTRLDAQGNGSAGHSYSYLDRAVTAGRSYSYKLVDVDISGERTVHDDYVVAATAISSPVPSEYSLSVYPNPFNPSTTIAYTITEAMPVQLAVYDITGRQVVMLVDGTLEAGNHEAAFDAAGLPSGIYMARLQTAENTLVTKMVLMK